MTADGPTGHSPPLKTEIRRYRVLSLFKLFLNKKKRNKTNTEFGTPEIEEEKGNTKGDKKMEISRFHLTPGSTATLLSKSLFARLCRNNFGTDSFDYIQFFYLQVELAGLSP